MSIHHMTVNFPTGDLLIADWFAAKPLLDFSPGLLFDVDRAPGRLQMTKHCLETFGLVTVSVGNSDPGVYAVDGGLLFAHMDEDLPSPYPALGTITTNLWQASIIDKAQLITLTAGRGDRAKAAKSVEEDIRDCGIIQAKVEPGVHHLYFADYIEDFTTEFHAEEMAFEHPVLPGFVLSRQPLTLLPKPNPGVPFGR